MSRPKSDLSASLPLVTFRRAFGYDPDAASADTALLCPDPSLTVQSQKDETDINLIVERFGITGELPITRREAFPLDVDFDEILDYRQCMDAINRANASFASLPANVRSQFANDPVAFADFASLPEHLDQLRKWGLAPAAPPAPDVPAASS